jgi:predicted ATP-binding protein involved in virulence
MPDKETHNDFSYFYKLELEGINCFKDRQTLDLSHDEKSHAPWTIILGDNGTGKTTLLRVLDRMQSFTKNNDKGKTTLLSMFDRRQNFARNNETIWPIYNEDHRLTKAHHIIKMEVENNQNQNAFTFNVFPDNWGQDLGSTFSIDDLKNNKYNNVLFSYGASRRMSKSQSIISKEEDSLKMTSLFDDSIELINAEEWLLQKELLSEKAEPSVKEKFGNQLTTVKEVLKDILPGIKEIRVKPINEANSKLLVEVEDEAFGWVNLRDLSHGYQTTTALIVDIAAKMMEQYPDSTNPLAEPVIILIDEIDLHLHPKWQRTVLDKLSQHFPAAQFIATSHSPLIVQAAQDKGANIVVCRKEGDRVIIDNDPDEVKGWRVDQILVSDLFEVDSSRSVKTQEKVDSYIANKGLEDISNQVDDSEIKELIKAEPKSGLDKKLEDFANKYLK